MPYSSDSQLNGGGLALLAAIIAIFCRRRDIGGWLLYFFFQVVLGLGLVLSTTHWGRFLATAWGDPRMYLLYTLSSLPRFIMLAAVAAITLTLFQTRARHWVTALTLALVTYGLLTLVKLQVDVFFFPDTVRLDALSLAFPVVWVVYFAESRRVQRVFR